MKKIILNSKALLPLLFIACSSLLSCSKSDNPDPDGDTPPPTKTELISRAWIQTDLIAKISTLSQSVFDEEIEACAQDNIVTFKADGTFTITENTVKCGAEDLVTKGTWAFTDSEKKIVIDPEDESPQTVTIEELTETSFKGSLVDNSMGMEITLLGIYKANK